MQNNHYLKSTAPLQILNFARPSSSPEPHIQGPIPPPSLSGPTKTRANKSQHVVFCTLRVSSGVRRIHLRYGGSTRMQTCEAGFSLGWMYSQRAAYSSTISWMSKESKRYIIAGGLIYLNYWNSARPTNYNAFQNKRIIPGVKYTMVFVTDGLLETLLNNAIQLPPFSPRNVLNVSMKWICPQQQKIHQHRKHIDNSACATIPLLKVEAFYIYTYAINSMIFSNINVYTQYIKSNNISVLFKYMLWFICT